MDFTVDEDLASVEQAAAKLAAAFGDQYWLEHDEACRFPWEFYDAFAEQGWLGILVPEAYGGVGLGLRHAGVLLKAVGESAGGMNAASTLHLSIFGMSPVIRHGSEDVKQRYLPETAKGELHTSFGVTEPDAGSDTSRITTFARRDGDHYVVNGQKIWNTKAQQCQKILLLARTTPREECLRPFEGMTLFLADLDPNHVDIRPIPKTGRNAVTSCEVFFHDLPVSETDVVGEVGSGFYHLLDGINAERILIAAEAVGIGHRAVQAAVRYATERVVFDRPIGMNQAIAHPLADAHGELEAADLPWQKAAWAYDTGAKRKEIGGLANMAKYRATEAAFRAADRAMQTFGGFGYAREYHVERYWREARVMRIVPVSNEMVLNFVAEHVLGLPKSY